MTSPSTILKRLALAGVAAAAVGAGVPVLLAGPALAGGPTANLSVGPAAQTTTAGTCQSYTVTATDSTGAKPSDTPTVTVTLTQNPAYSGTIAFCNPSGTGAVGSPGNKTTSPATGTGVAPASTTQDFGTTAAPNGTVRATFGVFSSTTGTVDVRAALANNSTVRSNIAKATFAAAGPSPTPTPTKSPAPTNPGGRQPLTLQVKTPLIPAGSTATLVGTGAANQVYELRCYTRPSTTYFTARQGAFDASGHPVTFTLSLGRNTRCFLRYATGAGQNTPSVVVNVGTVLSLSTVRTAVRTYLFQGRNLPRIAGQLITLYRLDNAGNQIRTSNLTTDSSGIYKVTRTFTGTGTFRFKVRTSQTLNNAAGVSNTITVDVH
ncbi:MAG: hypothetical protein NVS3B26_12960 [Mycobacteriales bacterium]